MRLPPFSLPDQHGTLHTHKEFEGKTTLLFAYPKALTPGCTTEACDAQSSLPALKKLGIQLYGISADPTPLQKKFADTHTLTYPLLSDTEKTLLAPLGVWALKKNYGREYSGIIRSTFLISPNLTIIKDWRNVKATNHLATVLAALPALLASTQAQ